jgi:DNA-binding NtrC family response regulator
VDGEYRLAFLNDARQFPQAHDIIGKRCYETIMGASRPCDFCPLQAILSGQRLRTSHVVRLGEKHYQVIASRLLCGDDTPLCVMRDITEQKQRELRLDTERRLLRSRLRQHESACTALAAVEDLLGMSKHWLAIKELIRELARFPSVTVLITGETGTGKELVARELQRRSARRDHEFVAFSCANVPENLLESELFGHEKGAFTGADRRKRGLFEVANGGTVFLDEIGEMSPAIQAKLLRFLQAGEFKPLGSEAIKKTDVRIIAATNRDLSAMMAQGQFREDLYYRLNVIEIKLPPLRERGEDILLIADYFLKRFARQFKAPVSAFSPEARALLLQYPFPGNVRELENLVQRAVVLAEGNAINLEDLAFVKSGERSDSSVPTSSFIQAKQEIIASFERDYICARLQETNGNISEAARRAGMHKKNFIQKMQQYGMRREDFTLS